EGIHIGYRAWLKQGAAPAYWFGSGQGYCDIELTGVDAPSFVEAGRTVSVIVELANRSERSGKQVVQVYAERDGSSVERPVRWLVGYAPVRLAGGATTQVEVRVPTRLLAHWDSGWQYEPGEYLLRVGTSVVDLPLEATGSLS